MLFGDGIEEIIQRFDPDRLKHRIPFFRGNWDIGHYLSPGLLVR
jgi:hypothetical protein